MTKEEKDLVLHDLCMRLPYGVKANSRDGKKTITITPIGIANFMNGAIDIIKPYLRPLSSMTEEESAELSNIINEWFDKELFYLTEESFLEYALQKINYSISPRLFDWLNKKMFDYRGLIPKGLAISTEIFNPYKE